MLAANFRSQLYCSVARRNLINKRARDFFPIKPFNYTLPQKRDIFSFFSFVAISSWTVHEKQNIFREQSQTEYEDVWLRKTNSWLCNMYHLQVLVAIGDINFGNSTVMARTCIYLFVAEVNLPALSHFSLALAKVSAALLIFNGPP